MYKFNIKSIIDYGNAYYATIINKVLVNNQEISLDNDLKLNVRVGKMNLDSGEISYDDSPLSLIKEGNHATEPTYQLVIDLKDSHDALFFTSRELDDFIDLEIRTKFPNEDIDTVKVEYVKSILRYLEDVGL